MSDYQHEKVIRCKVDLKKLGIEDIFDLENLYPNLFGYGSINQLNIAPVEEMEYIDYVLYNEYDNAGEFGYSRYLTEDEQEKYLPIFKQIFSDVRADDLRAVDFLRIVVCKYDFSNTYTVWIDNLHSSIKYIRKYGINVKLRDVPFYVVDISDYNNPTINGYNCSLRENYEDILGAISCAYKRFRRSNSKELIEIRYTLGDFLYDNPQFTKKTTN